MTGGLTVLDRLEYATSDDPPLNYCLWRYVPPAPAEDKLRSVNLLYQSFDLAGVDDRAYAVVEALRQAIGDFRTVFGIKLLDGRLAWEFYFYDYRRGSREVSVTRVLDVLRPLVACAVRPSEHLPYFMFSLDFDAVVFAGRQGFDVVHMYIGNPGSTVSSGIAYAARADSMQLENFYFFFDARTQLTEVAKKLSSSAFLDPERVPIDTILIPELRECQTICVANKQTHDCIYFSGIKAAQLLWFLRRIGYPTPTIDFVQTHAAKLDHLLFDVGIDFRIENGGLTIIKSGFYGVF